MYDVFNIWSRLMAAGFSLRQTGMRAAQTAHAANKVIAVCTPMINAALLSPLTGNYKELSLMVPEKVEAFSRSSSAAMAAWWKAQASWMGHMHHLGAMVTRGRPQTLSELIDLNERNAVMTMESVEVVARVGERTLAPVHTKAIANA